MGAHPQRKDQAFETDVHTPTPQEKPTAGTLMKDTRLAQNKKIPSISRELKIAESYLSAIENGEVHELPERVYTLGFVRTYSTYLGLDTQSIVEQFKEESVGFKNQTKPYTIPDSYTPEKGPSRSLFLISSLLLTLAGAAWLGYHFWYENQLPEETTPLPPAPIIDPEPTIKSIPGVSPHDTHEGAHPTFSQEAEDFARSLISNSSQNIPAPAAIEPHQGAEQELSVPNQPTAELAPVHNEPLEAAATHNTSLHFDQESWIQIRDAQGNIVVRRLFQAGQSYTLPHGKGLTLRVGNAGGIYFAKGTQKSAPLGKKGEIVANVSLDPANIDGYLKPQE